MSTRDAMPRQISHYRVISALGAGGMGEVYLAEDSRLGRHVAIKVLPPESTRNPDSVRRFTQEARAASALNHPNIVTVHDIGECESGHFLVMELVSGSTLRAYTGQARPIHALLPWFEQMAKALMAAHAAGITHRDLKPENIMIRNDGYVKILDFGLARLSSGQNEDTTVLNATLPGQVIGTVRYMSPEQARGEAVGTASDIFSLGVVFYELAAARYPFQAENAVGYLHAINSQQPPPLAAPDALSRLILAMLAKKSAERPSAREVAGILSALAKGEAAALETQVLPPKTDDGTLQPRNEDSLRIAVLPFKSRTSDTLAAALAEGLTEDIIAGFSRFSYLRVLASGATTRFTGDQTDPGAVGKQLGVRYVLEGSLRQNGPICRLTVRLVESATGSQLWSHAFDRRIDADHVFAVQDEWVSAIVARVGDQHGALVRDMVRTFGNKKPEELTAHEAVLSVLSFHERMSQQEHARLRSILERLVKESPDSSDCWAMLATLYNDEYMFGFPGEPDPLARARDAAQRAFELAPANPLACQAQFQSLFFRKEWQAFRPVAERTLALNPLDSATVAFAGILLTLSGAWDLGCGAIESAIRLNPDHPSWYWLGPVFRAFHLEDYQAAADLAMRLYMPGYFWGPAALASAYGHLDQPEAAQRALKELLAVRPDFARTARAEFEKWMSPELADRFVAGLAKAGVATGGVATGAAVSVSSQGASGSSSGGGFWIAVPAFRAIGTHPDVAALQESFAEEIIAGLCRFPYLRVLTKGTAGARYILEGNLRQAGQQLRVAVRLIETTTGANLWAENYSRTFSPEAPFEIQESLVPTIVSTIGETNGVLTHSMWTSLRDRDPLTLTPYEAMLRCFGALETQSPEELTLAAVALERAVEQEPRNSGCLAMLAVVHTHSYGLGYSKHPDPVEAGLSYARRAVTAEPSNHLAHLVLAMAQFFRNDAIAFRAAADRALALNPMDGYTLANLGMRTAYLGDWDRGCEMVRRAMQLNPRHPGWYWLPLLANAYRNRDFTAALGMAQQMNMPGLWHAAAVVVAIHGQLGNRKEARMAIRELAQLGVQDPRPSFERYLLDPEIMALFVDGWRKAGLYDAPESDSGMSRSGSARAGDGFWVAVLPFEAVGSEAAAVFADGLFEETLTGMSRFSYLRLIARSSVRQYAGSRSDVRAIGRELGARYVMEGSVRQAGAQIRLTVQISDVSTGAQLWTETFNRPFDPEQIFALQDELAPRIVCTVSDSFGVLVRAMSDELRRKPDEDLTPHDAVLLAFGYVFRHTAEDHLRARTALERAVEAEPDNASCWAMLSTIYLNEHMHGWNPQPDPVGRSLAAARRAVDLGPTNSMAHYARAAAQFFAKRFAEFRADAERALQLNPWDGITLAWVGALWASCLDWDEGEALLLRAQSYNPTHPYWYHSTSVWNRYRRGEYAAALDRLQGIRISVPDPLWASLRAAVFGQLGQTGPAREALDELCRLRPDFPGQLRAWLETFFQPEMVQHILDGLRKAGLEQPSTAGVRGDGFWIAVAPFQAEGGDTAVLASGLSAELITALSRFTYLRVLTKGAAGARYVVEGAVRQAGAQVRVSTKLIDTQTGANLWAESYTRPCTPETVFEVLAALIASSIGDSHGVLPRSISNSLRSRKPEELTPYEAVLRSFGYLERGTPEELVLARDALRGALSKEPDYADALAMLSFLLVQDYAHGFDLTPDALLEGTALARRAAELAPSSSLSWRSLAQALFFQRDDGFRNAAERAVALNPQDADTLAFAGELLMYRGDSTRGLELSAAAKRLSPNHTGWYWYADTFHAEYNLCDSAAALGYLNRIQLDKHYALHLFKASVLGHLGQREAAARSLGRFVELRPDAAQRIRSHMSRWWSNEHVDRLMEGLRRAGLGATRSEDAFRVAVAPFRVESGGSEVAALASGLSEEIVTALSRFTCLRALPKGTDGARYVLEGSVRQMGAQLRVAVRLLDTSSGNHLWAETYSRAYSPDRIFEVQDELVPVIVSPVAETNGALEHNMWIALRDRDPLTLTPFEALLRSRGFFELHTVDEYRLAIATLKRAVEQEPNHAGCLASLSWIYSLGYLFGWDMEADPAGLGLSYARRAVGAEPACQEAHVALLYAYACRKEIGGVRTAAERVLALNPFNGFAVFVTGLWRAYSGDWQEGCELVRKAQGLNPRHTGSYWYPLAHAALRRSDYEGGLKCALSINLPGQFWTHLLLAVAHSGLGQATEAAAAVKDLLALEPEFAASARHRIARWFFEDSHVELLLHGLRKAGLVVGTLPGGSTLAPEPPRQLLGTPAGVPAHSLAVLPFANLGGDKDQEYFSDGLAEEILNLLAEVPGLKTIARTSSFAFRGKEDDVRSIAGALNVTHVLQGSVRRSGDRIRVSAQLIAAGDGSTLWSERYDRRMDDLFALQDDIAASITSQLKVRVAPGSSRTRRHPNLEAYDAYLRYRQHQWEFTPEALRRSRECLELAISLDPEFALPYVGLADHFFAQTQFAPAREWVPRLREMAGRAIALDPGLSEAQAMHGILTGMFDRRWAEAERWFAKALAHPVVHWHVRVWYAWFYLQVLGRSEEARRHVEIALADNPLNHMVHWARGAVLESLSSPQEAAGAYRKILELEPHNWMAAWAFALQQARHGQFDEARRLAGQAMAAAPWAAYSRGATAGVLIHEGKADEARSLLAGPQSPVAKACAAIALSDADGAAAAMIEAMEQDYVKSVVMLIGPHRPLLRRSQRWRELAAKLELPHE